MPMKLLAQGGGTNTTANVHGWSYFSGGVEIGAMGSVPGVNLRYHHKERWSVSGGAGFYGMGYAPYGRMSYTFKRNQNFRKGSKRKRGFTRYYSQAWVGYRHFIETDWIDLDIEELPVGPMVMAGLTREWKQEKKSRRLSIGIGAMLNSDGNYLPFYPEVTYSFDWPFLLRTR